jgi:hypothetical protein
MALVTIIRKHWERPCYTSPQTPLPPLGFPLAGERYTTCSDWFFRKTSETEANQETAPVVAAPDTPLFQPEPSAALLQIILQKPTTICIEVEDARMHHISQK